MAPPHRNLALSTRLVVRLRRRIHHYRCDRNGQPYPAPWTCFAGDVALCAVAQPERLSSHRRRRRTSFVTHPLPPTRTPSTNHLCSHGPRDATHHRTDDRRRAKTFAPRAHTR